MDITSGEVAKGYDFCTCIDVNDLYFCVVCVAMPDVRVSIPKIFSPCHRIPGDFPCVPLCEFPCSLVRVPLSQVPKKDFPTIRTFKIELSRQAVHAHVKLIVRKVRALSDLVKDLQHLVLGSGNLERFRIARVQCKDN